MYTLIFTEQFDRSFSKFKEKNLQEQIWKKILELEDKAPLGKKLKGNPYWSIHINKYRAIYQIDGSKITIIDILKRKHDYREL
ncbi:MAG TPA: type II toxin-antitoxin system RelE/ParE family toxin [Candidatus Nanoarchaeia archaeon]|nr:type II toxin-antitoxin system RelE/ParE family toxin [Candidatus Nanoarchaeia archaeon]